MKKMSISMGFMKPITSFFKKYTALLPSIVITMVALLLFLPTMLVGRSVKEEMEDSVKLAGNVSQLSRKVPSQDTPGQIENYMNHFEEDAEKIETMAVESSMRELIYYNVFPPKDTSTQLYVNFGEKYRIAIENLLDNMNALDAPSDAEIRNQTGGDSRDLRTTRTTRRTTRNDNEVDPMLDALCLKRSQEISVYANPSVFAWYDFWKEYEFLDEDQALEDCWDSQVAFWIYEDVVETIRKMNEGSQAVSSSPVKRLLGVSFTGPVEIETSRGSNARSTQTVGFRDKPEYLLSAGGQGAMGGGNTPVSTASVFVSSSLTGRSGDKDVDVIHFAFSVLVDNRFVMAFMKELCSEKAHVFRAEFKEDGQEKSSSHNQITILNNDISVVDKQDPDHEFHRYGNGAVMRLDLVCEYQFYRKGYDVIKPKPVKELLGQTDTSTGDNKAGARGQGF